MDCKYGNFVNSQQIYDPWSKFCFCLKDIEKCMDFDQVLIYHLMSVIQWIMSCHKNRMTTRYITYSREQVMS